MDLVEHKVKDKQSAKWDRNSKNRELVDYSRNAKASQNCKICYYNAKQKSGNGDNFLDARIGESEHWLVIYPLSIKPLVPMGTAEPKTHF